MLQSVTHNKISSKLSMKTFEVFNIHIWGKYSYSTHFVTPRSQNRSLQRFVTHLTIGCDMSSSQLCMFWARAASLVLRAAGEAGTRPSSNAGAGTELYPAFSSVKKVENSTTNSSQLPGDGIV